MLEVCVHTRPLALPPSSSSSPSLLLNFVVKNLLRILIALITRLFMTCVSEGYTDEPVLATSHALAQRHHQLTGASYSLLARQFSEEGGLLMECLSDDTKKELCDVIKRDPSADLALHEVGSGASRQCNHI